MTGDESLQARFVEEIRRSIESYQSEDIEASPASVIMTGSTENVRHLQDTINNSLRIPTRIVNYRELLPLTEKVAETVKNAKNTSFLNVMSPLLCPYKMNVDLAPDEIKLKKSIEQRGRDIIKTGVFVCAIIFVLCGLLLGKIYFKSVYLSDLKARYKPIKEEAGRLEKLFSKTKTIRDYMSDRGRALEVLAELHSLLPDEVYVKNVKLDEDGSFSIRGSSESTSAVFSFVDSMEKSDWFKNAKTKYTTRRKEDDKDFTDFEVVSTLEK
jgi:Tfp pilus assembly protein PilN